MPTIAGLRRRGVPPEALRDFVKRIGVAKANSVVDVGMLEFCIREDLNKTAQRRMAVLRPLKVVIENYPEGQVEELDADQPSRGSRRRARARFRSAASSTSSRTTSWRTRRRSSSGCRRAAKCGCATPISSSAAKRSRTPPARSSSCAAPTIPRPRAATRPTDARSRRPCTGCRRRTRCRRKSASTTSCSPIRTRSARTFAADLNPQSLEILPDARVEPGVAADNSNEVVQFERQGYFVRDKDSAPGKPVFNRTIGLRDTFAKEVAKS